MAHENGVLAPGEKFGRYTIVRKIGQGGMGAVYEAVHDGLKKRVAIKTLDAAMAKNPDLLVRFLREGEAAARLRHPHVVDITDVGTEEGIAHLVMEFLEGEDLAHQVRRERVLTPARVADLMLPVCSAVAAAHALGIVHRDLKPANIFLTRTIHGEQPKLLDFGISKLEDPAGDANLTRTTAVLGTAAYMSPEQAMGARNADAKSDQYSLGVILYECVCGQRPFRRAETDSSMYQLLHAIVQGAFDPPRTVRPDVDPAFEQVILRAMARDPEQRYPTVGALAAALLPFASPATRAVWSPQFGNLSVDAAPIAHDPHNPFAPSIPTSAPGTVELNTLGQGAHTVNAAPVPLAVAKSARGWLVVAGVMALAFGVGGGITLLVQRRLPPVTAAPAQRAAARPVRAAPMVAPDPSAPVQPPATPPVVPVASSAPPVPAPLQPPAVPAVDAAPTTAPATVHPTASHRPRGARPHDGPATSGSGYYIP